MKGLITLAIFAIGLGAFAQTSGTIKGRIHDENGETMPGAYASIMIGETETKVAADMDGNFVIKPVNSGTYILTIDYIGYEPRKYQVEVKTDQITMLNDLAFSSEATDLTGITVKTKMIDPEETSLITLSAKQIKNSPKLRDQAGLIASMDSGISQGADGELYFRGSRSDGVVQFIDGVKRTGTMSSLPGVAIGRVSVYTGGIPAKYGDTTSGVIVMETKSYFDLYNERKAGLR